MSRRRHALLRATQGRAAGTSADRGDQGPRRPRDPGARAGPGVRQRGGEPEEDVRAIEAAGVAVDVSLPQTVGAGAGGHPPVGEAPLGGIARRRRRSWRPGSNGKPRRSRRRAAAALSLCLLDLEGPVDDGLRRHLRRGPAAPGRRRQRVRKGGRALSHGAPGRGAVARAPRCTSSRTSRIPSVADRHGDLTAELFGPGSRRLFVEGDDYCWHGVRTLDGLEAMRKLRSGVSPRRTGIPRFTRDAAASFAQPRRFSRSRNSSRTGLL